MGFLQGWLARRGPQFGAIEETIDAVRRAAALEAVRRQAMGKQVQQRAQTIAGALPGYRAGDTASTAVMAALGLARPQAPEQAQAQQFSQDIAKRRLGQTEESLALRKAEAERLAEQFRQSLGMREKESKSAAERWLKELELSRERLGLSKESLAMRKEEAAKREQKTGEAEKKTSAEREARKKAVTDYLTSHGFDEKTAAAMADLGVSGGQLLASEFTRRAQERRATSQSPWLEVETARQKAQAVAEETGEDPQDVLRKMMGLGPQKRKVEDLANYAEYSLQYRELAVDPAKQAAFVRQLAQKARKGDPAAEQFLRALMEE